MVTATRFRGRREWRLTSGFHGEVVGGEWRAVRGGAVGEVLWAMAQQGMRASSPEYARDGELTTAAFLARGARQSGSGRVHSARGNAVEVMRALGADERGHRRHTDDIWRTGGVLAIPDGELGFDSEKTATD